MPLMEQGCLLRIFCGERDRMEGAPLYEWLITKARDEGLAGATAFRGLMGYGANSRIHTAKILRLSDEMPIVVEVVDSCDKLEAFLDRIAPRICEGLITLEKADIRFMRGCDTWSSPGS